MEPARDLDPYGVIIFSGDVPGVRDDFAERVSRLLATSSSEEDARKAAAQEIYKCSWGPTRVPVYDLILLARLILGDSQPHLLDVARFLISEAKVPVDGVDLSGSQAIYHCVTTKPAFDPEFAQILYDAGGDVNARNRYGGTPAHEIVLVYDLVDRQKMQRSADALKWVLDHGGNLDVKDNDGSTARGCIDTMRSKLSSARRNLRLPMWDVLDREDRRRVRLADSICGFCGRDDVKLLKCSQCMKVRYCAPPRGCQKMDWPKHKVPCKAASSTQPQPAAQATYLGMPLS
ncbi:uncharacterized protein B0H18DRAFT_589741 [Fomitopsis serialis]|uniref:uncharacterized protein n=1 Tax=Fomitopsis serialis TaxID=139415 RepID=UPI00200813F6|nr:uncharacterized protein B0H18DRAFT_589741 [Neoantrodia serialis]KAH9920638.1 hypothetical protein B0H18DRAFT_589741 [Neoantrodia serialis]